MSEPHPTEKLHRVIGETLSDPRLSGTTADGVVTRWVLVAEVALSDNRMAMNTIASSASGTELRSWERAGLLTMALSRCLGNPPFPPQPEDT